MATDAALEPLSRPLQEENVARPFPDTLKHETEGVRGISTSQGEKTTAEFHSSETS